MICEQAVPLEMIVEGGLVVAGRVATRPLAHPTNIQATVQNVVVINHKQKVQNNLSFFSAIKDQKQHIWNILYVCTYELNIHNNP